MNVSVLLEAFHTRCLKFIVYNNNNTNDNNSVGSSLHGNTEEDRQVRQTEQHMHNVFYPFDVETGAWHTRNVLDCNQSIFRL